MLRKALSVLLTLSIFIGMLPVLVAAEGVEGNFGSGTWDDPKQGYRFSVYDTYLCKTVGCIDFLDSESFSRYLSEFEKGYNFRTACGNKMEYLHMYEQGATINEIAENILWYENCSFDYMVKEYVTNGTEDSEALNSALRPIYTKSLGDGTYEWYAQQNMRLLLSESLDILYAENILNETGFSIIGDPEYEYFGEEYILVVEPLFWFFNRTTTTRVDDRYYGTDGFFLYGTATEWALMDQLYFDNGMVFYNAEYDILASIHGTMGSLTYVGGPASCLVGKAREIELGDGTIIDISASDPKASDLKSRRPSKDTSAWHEAVNTLILKKYGVEFVTPRDLAELNIDIVSDNTLFRTNSTGMLSFYALSSGELEYLPDYGELCLNPEAYGIKLVLSTEPGSELKLGTMEIFSYGMPSGENQLISTYIFEDFETPSRAGSWTFRLTAYGSSGERLNYTSGNGSYEDDGEYTFTVAFMDIPTEYPADALADDEMPKGFETAEFSLAANPYTATRTPVTHTEWHYYDAVPFENTSTGETFVLTFLRDKSADADMQGLYLPKIYNNVATAKLRGGEYYTRSGYGIGVEITAEQAQSVGAQGFEAGLVLFPEYNYANYACQLERVGDSLVMEMNPYSMYCGDILYSDYSRVHFTPVWYPDGDYNIVVFLYEYWTPAGMLWDYAEYTIHLSGTVYDDWYITRN